MTDNIDGTLKNARLVLSGDPRCPCLCGNVYGDTKGRFRDGEFITTSTLQSQETGCVFKTRCSVYKVETLA